MSTPDLPPEVDAAIEERAVMLSTLHFGPLHLLRAGIERTAAESHHAALVNNMREAAHLAYALGLAAGAQGEREAQDEAVRLREALRAVTADMDRAGGDPYGMPECPWCRRGPDGDDHNADCELQAARALLAAPDALRSVDCIVPAERASEGSR